MLNIFLNSPWPGLVAWWILYISDYAMTLWGARLRKKASDKIVFSGSYELTPYFQADIDKLKLVSRKFVVALVFSSLVLAAIWRLSVQTVPEAYSFVLGIYILIEAAVHVRHWRNVFFFRTLIKGDGVRGRIEYSHAVSLHSSSVEMFAFAGMFALTFVFTGSWFILGGVVECLMTGVKHRRLSRACQSAPIGKETARTQEPIPAEDMEGTAPELVQTR